MAGSAAWASRHPSPPQRQGLGSGASTRRCPSSPAEPREPATYRPSSFRPQAIVGTALLGALASVGAVLLFPGLHWLLWLGTVGLGLSLAAIVPTTLALIGRRIGATSQATAWFFVGLGAGKMTIPWTIGQFFESAGPQTLFVVMGLVLVVALALFAGLGAVALLALVLVRATRRGYSPLGLVSARADAALVTTLRARTHPGLSPESLPSMDDLMPWYLYLMGADSRAVRGQIVECRS